MALALVGGSFLSAFLQVLFDRMASDEFLNLFRERKYDEGLLKELKMNLLAVAAVLDDAENKQTRTPAIRRWLDELHDAVNEAEDLLDKINTEALRLKVETEYQSSTNQNRVCNHLMSLFRRIDHKELKSLPGQMQSLLAPRRCIEMWQCPAIACFYVRELVPDWKPVTSC